MTLSMPLRLIIEDDEGATTIVPLGKEAITIGRQQGNTIQLTEKNVSRAHARLFQDDEAWMIEDLNSYNGIKVNDKPVDGHMKLREGDIVQIGDYHLAITEDVDKRTLNYDRHGQVANDGDPMLASSSADLPRLSPDEIHALSSGPQPITPAPAPMMLDSGPVPATPYAGAQPETQRKGGGLLIVVGLLVLGAGAVGAFMLANGSKEEGKTTAAAAEKPGAADDGAKATPTAPPTKAVQPTVVPPAADDGAVAPEPTPPPADANPIPEPTPPPDDDVVIDDEPTPTPVPTPPVKKKPKANGNGAAKPKPKPKPKPAPPKDTGPSADELYDQARKMGLKNPAEAYRLAKQSYGKKSSQKAALLMGTNACKMGDKAKAKGAYNKLRGKNKEDMKKLCENKGVSL